MTTSPNGASSAVTLGRMPQQFEVIKPGDDWTGVASNVKRRRLQNRLNQRAYRRRKLLESQNAKSEDPAERDQHIEGNEAKNDTEDRREWLSPPQGCQLALAGKRRKLLEFSKQAYNDYILASPRPSALQTLIQLNVVNALCDNAATLRIPIETLCDDEAVSQFNRQGPSMPCESYPPALRPTSVQLAIRHHPWIDILPIPAMRDNLIRACGSIDEDQLNIDLVDIQEGNAEKPNLIVWGNPSDPAAWEATIPFIRKWGWLIRGCRELLDSTNHWREVRGEKRLIFEVP